MSRRRKFPHCFYCNQPTNGGISRIDSSSPVCTSCAYLEAVDPQTAVDRWFALGGDRVAALEFIETVNFHRRPRTSGGPRALRRPHVASAGGVR